MRATGLHPKPGLLKQFNTLKSLDDDQLALLAGAVEIHQAPAGQRVIKRGDTKELSFLLLKGEIELVAGDGRRRRMKAGTESALNPIAQLLPRRFDVFAVTPIAYLVLDAKLLDGLHDSSRQDLEQSTMLVEETDADRGQNGDPARDDEDLLLSKLRADLEQDCLVLPSLPDVAFRIGQALNDGISDARDIAQIIQMDPVITAKIIKTANSAFYARREPVDNCALAVVRLGVHATHQLVLGFALREVFRGGSGQLKERMAQLLTHSSHVAAICYVLARLTRKFNPEHAMLAGLIHDIGTVAILGYAQRYPHLANSHQQIDQAVEHLRGEIGGLILHQWNFEEDFVVAAREAESWFRNPGEQADYCDLVIVAQLHSYVGTPRMEVLPHLGEVPSFGKLGLGELTPRQSLKILDKAKEQLDQAEQLLKG